MGKRATETGQSCEPNKKGTVPVPYLPPDIIQIILSSFDNKELGTCSLVCKTWKNLSIKVQARNLLRESCFGKEMWNKFFGDIGEEPPLPEPMAIINILQSPCPFWGDKGLRVIDTHIGFVLIPATINNTPYNLETLEKIVENPKEGKPTKLNISQLASQAKKSAIFPIEKSYWVLATKDIVPQPKKKAKAQSTRGNVGGKMNFDEFYNKSKRAIKSVETTGYSALKAVESATCIFMNYFRSGEAQDRILEPVFITNPEKSKTRLAGPDSVKVLTYCQEGVSEPIFAVCVGNFHANDGLEVRSIGLNESGLAGVMLARTF